jgi:peptide/nickel transport system substrate-binding protein
MMKRKKALSTQQYVIIAAIVIVVLIAGFYTLRPKPEPEPEPEPEENIKPIVVAVAKTPYVQVGDVVEYSAEGTKDPDGTVVAYEWDFGDNTFGEGETVTHTYELPGDYLAVFTAVDDDGEATLSDITPIFVKVERKPAVYTLESPPLALLAVSQQVVDEEEEVMFDGASSYGWKIARGAPNPDTSKVVKWEWDFGDGTTGSGKNATHMYAISGTYPVKLTVTDESGQTDAVTRTIRVLPPGTEYEGVIKNPDTYVCATTLDLWGTLDFRLTTGSTPGRQSCLALTDRLVFVGPGVMEPNAEGSLSERWEISDDSRQITFYLRKGIKFWNGDEFKAEDVEYTFERYMALTAARGRWSIQWERLTGVPMGEPVPDEAIKNSILVLDDYTVMFNFSEPYAPFLDGLPYPRMGIVQKRHAIENGAWHWDDGKDYAVIDGVDDGWVDGSALMGTGPFKLMEFIPGEMYVFERNDDYWKGPAKIKYVKFFAVPEWSTRLLMLKAGDVDEIAVATAEEFEQLVGLPGITPVSVPAQFIEGFFFMQSSMWDPAKSPPDNHVPPDFFDDVHMRKAFAYAFPYERYVNEVWLGYAEPATGVLPEGWPWSFNDFPYYYDLEKAEEELKLAHNGKYHEEGFQMTAAVQMWALPTHGRGFEMLEEELQKINPNIKIIIVGTSWTSMLQTPAMGAINGMIRPDPIQYRSFYSSAGWNSYYGYKNELVDEMIEESTLYARAEDRFPIIKEAVEIAAEECPVLFTVYKPAMAAHRDYIHGYWYNTLLATDPGYYYDISKGSP